jgi:putative ABC transport system ATP-binding protein
VISLRNIRKDYRAGTLETAALADVSLQIDEGEFVAVMGPSGCGKSTLLNVIGMIDSPSSGEYFFCGQEVAQWPESRLVELRKRNLGFIFQSFNLIDDLTVYENIELPLLYQNAPRAHRRARVREVLELVDLLARAKHKPAQLSGGQQQRVAVARAVVMDPKLILADEPTGNLDTRNGEEVMGMLDILNQQGTTVLMVTHSHAHAARAHRIVNMLDGRITTQTHAARTANSAEVAHV